MRENDALECANPLAFCGGRVLCVSPHNPKPKAPEDWRTPKASRMRLVWACGEAMAFGGYLCAQEGVVCKQPVTGLLDGAALRQEPARGEPGREGCGQKSEPPPRRGPRGR